MVCEELILSENDTFCASIGIEKIASYNPGGDDDYGDLGDDLVEGDEADGPGDDSFDWSLGHHRRPKKIPCFELSH